MAVTAHYYDSFFKSVYNKEVDVDTDVLKLMLCTSTYTPNQGTHQYKSSVTNEVASGNGYTTGGNTIGSVTVSVNTGTHVINITGANGSWPASTFTARYAVLYDSSPATDATRPLILFVDFGADQSPSNGTLSVTWDASGIATVTVS